MTPSPPPAGRPLMAPLFAGVVLAVMALFTVELFRGQLPVGAGAGGGGGPARTPTPSNVVQVDPRAKVPGSIVYAKAGNLWIQSGASVRQLTTAGTDAMPTWSPDGRFIYFIRTQTGRGLFPQGCTGTPAWYTLTVPVLMRIPADGSGTAETIFSGLIHRGTYTWFAWVRQPAVSPDGRRIALVSDQPDPCRSDVVLQLLDLATGKVAPLPVSEVPPLGHQDPAWRPDGRVLAYVRNDRQGARGTPAIWRYTLASRTSAPLSGPGYTQPAWSPDGRYLAATATDPFGTDVVILDPATGAQILRVTTDHASWAPAWSPAGDALVFLHLAGGIVDLRLVPLEGSPPAWAVGEPLDLTVASDLDPSSRPGWFIPPEELPPSSAPSATPTGPGGSQSGPVGSPSGPGQPGPASTGAP
jgi:dipeptidyl aminopeptidase/acylaminoacyl peptidase